jgi:hypothetical protein
LSSNAPQAPTEIATTKPSETWKRWLADAADGEIAKIVAGVSLEQPVTDTCIED